MAMSTSVTISTLSHPPRTPSASASPSVDELSSTEDEVDDDEEEIDQLDSDTTEEVDVPTSGARLNGKGSGKGKGKGKQKGTTILLNLGYNRPKPERIPGHSTIPLARVEDMLESEGACHKPEDYFIGTGVLTSCRTQ